MFSTLSAFESQKRFTVTNSCLEYLAEMKWKDGFICRRCGCHVYTKAYIRFGRRCGSCRYEFITTAVNAIFNLTWVNSVSERIDETPNKEFSVH